MAAKHVAVLMGGWSSEREVSLRSGAACAAALENRGYRVTRVDVQRDIATVLPDSTAIVAFRIDSAGGTFTALATHVADVVSALADVDDLVAPRLAGAITRESTGGTRLERAAIRFRFSAPGRRS